MLDIEIAREDSEYLYATRVTFDKTLSVTRRPICVCQPCIIGYEKEMNSFTMYSRKQLEQKLYAKLMHDKAKPKLYRQRTKDERSVKIKRKCRER